MKAILISVLLSLSLNRFACKKDHSALSPEDLHGTWTGTYTVDQLPDLPPLQYTFFIKPGGELLTEGMGGDGRLYRHKGTWKLKGVTFTATYTTINRYWSEVTQSAKMTYSAGAFINATWTDVKNPDGHLDGKFQGIKRAE
ncbi:hypothetical protein LZZ85_14005 [Terrimonas sp. NA20]|uniref:Lipocalin-like domain-containing protein n=1 Tax=Terrimonas ginsenosidimutans TaxID=2908004 RepID=A0ABS9KSV7_9BACT|nr:hypothetical protein [Terrimonas ginsenosidimutans]MCG2615409.1 hypothetical protein [Terrimonas ginsenosidimutans]